MMKAKTLVLASIVFALGAHASDKAVEMVELPITKMYMVRDGENNIRYISGDGRYTFEGKMVDGWVQRDLSDLQDIGKVDWRRTGIDLAATTISVGTGKKSVQLFVSQECAECATMVRYAFTQKELKTNVFLLAATERGQKANERIWCAKDRAVALKNAFIDGVKSTESTRCMTTPLSVADVTAKTIGVSALPAMVIDGHVYSGSADELIAKLGEIK